MTRDQALKIAETTGLSVILINGMHVLVDHHDAEKADLLGVGFCWVMRSKRIGIVNIPNGTAGKQ